MAIADPGKLNLNVQLGVNFADVEITICNGEWHAEFTPLSLAQGPGKVSTSGLSNQKSAVTMSDLDGKTNVTSTLEGEYHSGL